MAQLFSAEVTWDVFTQNGSWVVIYATAPQSNGILQPRESAYRFMGFALDEDGVFDFASGWNQRFGTCQANQVIFVKVDVISPSGLRITITRAKVVIF